MLGFVGSNIGFWASPSLYTALPDHGQPDDRAVRRSERREDSDNGERLEVRFSSDSPELTPGSAGVLLRLLRNAAAHRGQQGHGRGLATRRGTVRTSGEWRDDAVCFLRAGPRPRISRIRRRHGTGSESGRCFGVVSAARCVAARWRPAPARTACTTAVPPGRWPPAHQPWQTTRQRSTCAKTRSGRPSTAGSVACSPERTLTALSPRFIATLGKESYRSVHAVPLRLRGEAIGGLNLFHRDPKALPDADLALGQALADVVTISILHEHAIRRGELPTGQLQRALHSRMITEQAKGMPAQRAKLSMETAFRQLRVHARTHNQRLSDLARKVVDDAFTVDKVLGTSAAQGAPAAGQ